MPTERPKIFISYAREDLGKALELYKDLAKAGCDPWIDKEKLRPGIKWKPAIQQEIKTSDFFLACLSKKSVSKIGFFQTELKEGYEILKQYPSQNIYLIPICLEDCDMPEELQEYNRLDLFEAEGFTKLLKAIQEEWKHRGFKWPEHREAEEEFIKRFKGIVPGFTNIIRDESLALAISNGVLALRFLNRFKDIVPGFIEILQDVRFPKMRNELSVLEEAQKILNNLQEGKKDYTAERLNDLSVKLSRAIFKVVNNLRTYPVPVAVEVLKKCARSEDVELRKQVAWALRELRDKSALEPMLESLRDENAEVRRAAALFMGDLGDKRAVNPLIELLRDDESNVRWAATWALGKLKDNNAVEPLINETLRDEIVEIRSQAAQSLAELGDKRAVEPLRIRLEVEKHEGVRKAIQDAMSRLETHI